MLHAQTDYKNGARGYSRPPFSEGKSFQLGRRSRSGSLSRFLPFSIWLGLCLIVFVPSARAQFWKPITLAAEPGRILALVSDPRNDSHIYLASPGGGVWETQDGGQYQWLPIFDSTRSGQVCSLALDPTTPGTLYAGTGDNLSPRPNQGVARSTDGGQTWSIGVRFTNQPVCALAVDPSNGARILAGSTEGMFLTTNSGGSWRKVQTVPITAVAFDGSGNIYAGELGPDSMGSRNNILARSSDGGLTWTNFSLPVPLTATSNQTTWVSILARGNNVFAAVCSEVFRSSDVTMDFYRTTDGGVTWTVSPGIGGANPPVKILTDATGKILYITGTSLLTSPDQGNTWNALPTNTTQFHDAVFTGPQLLLAGENGMELLLPSQAGQGNETSLPVVPVGQFLDVAVGSAGNIWAAGPSGLFSVLNPGVAAVPMGSVGATANSMNIFAAGNENVYRSIDAGTAFSSSAVISPGELRAPLPPLVMDPSSATTAYLAGQVIYHTTNSGTAWTALTTIDPDPRRVVVALAVAPTARRTLYAATACLPQVILRSCPNNNSVIWSSQNSGTSWTQMSAVQGLADHLTVDPRQTATVYVAIGAFQGGPNTTSGYLPGDLLRSTDSGATWTSVKGNLPQVPINAIAIDPTSIPTTTTTTPRLPTLPVGGGAFGGGGTGGAGGGTIVIPTAPGANAASQPAQTLYAGTDAGVFVSFNAGQQWMGINSGLPPAPVTQLSLQQPAGTLEAATFGRGIYQASVTGLSASVIANPLSGSLTLNQGSTTSLFLYLANFSTVAQTWQLTPMDSWLTVSQPGGTLASGIFSTASFQVSAANLPVGTYAGRMQLTTGSLVQTIVVTLQVTTPPASMAIASGNNATGAAGASLAPFVVSLLDATGTPVPGVPVNFSIAGGGGTLSSLTSFSDATGTASTTLTLPGTPGVTQVVASAGAFSVTFTATGILVVPPALMANSVVNGVTFSSTSPPSPGSIVSIFGQNLAASNGLASGFPLPVSLQNTSVLLDTAAGEVALPLFFVSPLQVNAMLPYDLIPGTYTLHIESNSVPSNPVQLAISAFSPGIFTLNTSGQGAGIFVKVDGSLVTAANPASPGSVVALYATGLGAVNPSIAAGQPGAGAEPLNRTVQTPLVFFDSFQADVLYSGLAPGFAGLYQLNVNIPAQVSPASNVSVSLSIGGFASNHVSIAVR